MPRAGTTNASSRPSNLSITNQELFCLTVGTAVSIYLQVSHGKKINWRARILQFYLANISPLDLFLISAPRQEVATPFELPETFADHQRTPTITTILLRESPAPSTIANPLFLPSTRDSHTTPNITAPPQSIAACYRCRAATEGAQSRTMLTCRRWTPNPTQPTHTPTRPLTHPPTTTNNLPLVLTSYFCFPPGVPTQRRNTTAQQQSVAACYRCRDAMGGGTTAPGHVYR